MDDIVKAALAKWPNVPHCHGWLALDARGDWYMRDDRVQALGRFADAARVPAAKGSRIDHDKLLAFIQRNYASDNQGCWYFQNGPQRVYVELEAAPWIWRVDNDAPARLTTHTQLEAQPTRWWLDERDRLFVESNLGLGLVHTQDMHVAATFVEHGKWQPQTTTHAALLARCGVELSPWERNASAARSRSP
jgi:hypothetical protein